MQTRHTVIESPIGGLTLAADGAAMTGVYFRHHWHPPTAGALGRYVEAGADVLFGVVPRHRVVGKDRALTGYAGGLERKRFLLDLEAPMPAAAGRLF